MELLSLCLFAFCAGFVDAIVGGGGLIQLPALLVTYPSAPLPLLFGTNKFASCLGTSVAALRYARSVAIPFGVTATSFAMAFAFSFFGARLTGHISSGLFRPVVVVILFLVLIFTLIRPSLGSIHAPKFSPGASIIIAGALSAAIGFYDGLIGPGTGSFLLFSFAAVLGFDFLHASACSKIINLSTNLAALAYFIPTGNVRYELALSMAAANMAGAYIGAHLSIKKGVRFIRLFLLLVVVALLVRQIQLLLASA